FVLAKAAREGESEGARRAGRTGRRVALVIYWALMIYIAAVGFISVVPQVFFPEFDPEMAPAGPCPEAYATLREELVEAAADHVGRENPDALAPLLDRWDDRYAALRDRCDDPGERELQLRHRLETTLRRYDRDEGTLLDALRASAPPEGNP
ncbi:MAG: hypothetical protein AAGH15_28900, partial [Myxococcota bacterium]